MPANDHALRFDLFFLMSSDSPMSHKVEKLSEISFPVSKIRLKFDSVPILQQSNIMKKCLHFVLF